MRAFQTSSVRTVSRLCGVLAVLSTSVGAVFLLFPKPLADVFFAGWVLVGVVLSAVGAIGSWTNRTPLVWAAALLLTGLSVVGMWSVGPFVAPAGLLLLGSALFSQRVGSRTGARETTVADTPTVREVVLKTVAGFGSVAVGTGFVYAGAFARELFGACARETVPCVVDKTNWGWVGITVFGLLAIGFGGWLLWTQVAVVRVLASEQTG